MANFCTKCGNPIYLCTCEDKENVSQQPKVAPKREGNFCTKCGKPLSECECNKFSGANTGSGSLNLKNFFGFSESDVLKKEDCYEIGKQIVPDLIDSCEGEIPIKQYEIGRVRRRLNLSWGYSRIQITNKRIIQRTVGRSFIGKDLQYQEFALDDIAGINFNKGKQFSIGDCLLLLLISLIFAGLGGLLSGVLDYEARPVLGSIVAILAIVAWIYIRFVQRKSSNVLFTFMFALATGICTGGTVMDMGRILWAIEFDGDFAEAIPAFFALVCFVLFVIYLIRGSLLPSVSVLVKTRVYASEGARVSAGIRVTEFKIGSIILPGCDTDKALREMGAIITDIQKLGDYGIDKWSKK